MALLSFRGISTPSLKAQGEQRRSSFFNIPRDIPRGRPPSRIRRDGEHAPISAKKLATGLPEDAWRIVPWREGSNETLSSRFAAVRVRPASRDRKRSTPHPVEWLLIEWPEGEKEPTKYWLSTLPEDIPINVLVDTAKLRWRIERDYEELKSELGMSRLLLKIAKRSLRFATYAASAI